jgi:hypothetical protein
MTVLKPISIAILALSLVACSQSDALKKLSPDQAADFAGRYVALFQARDIGAIEAKIDQDVLNADPYLRTKLQQQVALVPPDLPRQVNFVSYKFTDSSTEGQNYTVVLQYEFPTTWLLATIVLALRHDQIVVRGVDLETRRQSLQETNRFSLLNRPLSTYVFLAYAIWVPCIIIYAMILCVGTPIEKRKWLWMTFILFGNFGNVALDWTTGKFAYRVLQVQVFASAFHSDPYGPVIIGSSLPLGALVFLNRRRRGLLSAKSA